MAITAVWYTAHLPSATQKAFVRFVLQGFLTPDGHATFFEDKFNLADPIKAE
jgi:hypothetical protein